ncbi:nucleotidyltransferase family protein [Saccharospirillum impatiens]|uniref:nucleotidyltransferase family protein n=1 Tax=Saccharospirillum impatiens TaxID=169438 RepID=UPI00048B23B0|nr:nucleotidyltransferase family protein [Saccharospirillum impatiens]
MKRETLIAQWITADPMRMEALTLASTLGLKDWCLAAGFVRNLVWDKTHGFSNATTLNDIDLIYFDAEDVSESREKALERHLYAMAALPWSVKNQARMHHRNSDSPYTSTADAMSYWVEVETAVGARIDTEGHITIVAPLGIDRLFDYTITPNVKRLKPNAFKQRMHDKNWLKTWPKLAVNN